MSKEHSELPQLVATGRAAEILGRSPATLKRWRYEGIGPAYVEIEGRVRYDVHVLLEFIRKNTRVPSVRALDEIGPWGSRSRIYPSSTNCNLYLPGFNLIEAAACPRPTDGARPRPCLGVGFLQ